MKILGIGLPRTGTYSLATAFNFLGYATKHYPETIEDIAKYQACSEVRFEPKNLLKKYPNSKFVYTTRNIDDWLKSCRKHSLHHKAEWNPFWLNPNDWIKIYEEKLRKIEGMPNLLIMNVCQGEGWEKLCPFLGVEAPNKTFPFLNQSSSYIPPTKFFL